MRQRPRRAQPPISDSLTHYLDSIGRYRLLNRDEEVALGRRIRIGDVEAVNQLVCANLRFVVTVAKQYQRHGVSLLDLIDEGNLGLIRAARKFDETKGVKFISYAAWWIRRAILRAVAEQAGIIRVPPRRTPSAHRVSSSASNLFQRLGREPRPHEIAQELAISEQEILSTISMARMPLSLDAPTARDDESLLDQVADDCTPPPDQEVLEKSRVMAISDALSQLRPRDAAIVRMHFGFDGREPMTLEEIGSCIGVTRERVRQIRDRALRVLRRNISHLALAG